MRFTLILGMIFFTGICYGKESKGKTILFAFGKAKIGDSIDMQERAKSAILQVGKYAKKHKKIKLVLWTEKIMTPREYMASNRKLNITSKVIKKQFRELSKTLTKEDTIFIYSHSHGRKNGFKGSTQPLGGIVLDLPKFSKKHKGTLLWNEYAKMILALPAKNVIVFTMSCFSGGLIKYLNKPSIKKKWIHRKKQGRNFVVITSTNELLFSMPIRTEGQIINPLTYAIKEMFRGRADGYLSRRDKDGKITYKEMIRFILETTKTINFRRNNAKPMVTGSYHKNSVLKMD